MEKQSKHYQFLSVIADAIANHAIFSKSLEHVMLLIDAEASKYYREELEDYEDWGEPTNKVKDEHKEQLKAIKKAFYPKKGISSDKYFLKGMRKAQKKHKSLKWKEGKE